MKIVFKISFLCYFLFLLTSCGELERDITIELKDPVRVLVVECYLEAGQPYRVLLTETKGFFEDLNACPLVKGATIIIRHNGISDTLTESFYFSANCPADSLFGFVPFFNADFTRFYNYGSTNICPLDYQNDFSIEVIDHLGERYATATTRFIPPVPIDTMTYTFNASGKKASVMIKAIDNGATVDFYRIMLHKGSLTKADPSGFFQLCNNPEFDASIDDARFFNGGTVAFGTGYDYRLGDTLIASFYHIDKAYHDFLETISDSESTNGSPFSQPSKILSNIVGGTGIFTFLSYHRDTLIIQ